MPSQLLTRGRAVDPTAWVADRIQANFDRVPAEDAPAGAPTAAPVVAAPAEHVLPAAPVPGPPTLVVRTARREPVATGAPSRPTSTTASGTVRSSVLPRRSRTLARRISGAVLSALALAVAGLTVGPMFLPYRTTVVLTGSMAPRLPVGSLLVLRPARAETLQVGDVIAFTRPDQPGTVVTHRIVGIEPGQGGRQFVTKGDNNGVPDAWRVPASGAGWRLAVGIPRAGYIAGATHSHKGRQVLGSVVAVGLLALAVGDRRRR